MECIIETKAATVLEFIQGLRGSLWATLTWRPLSGLSVQSRQFFTLLDDETGKEVWNSGGRCGTQTAERSDRTDDR
jgi:hypothetical protein